MEQYKSGERINVPRELLPILKDLISRREVLDKEYRYEVATAFGYGSKEIGKGFEFALDYKKGVAFAYNKTPDVRIAEAPMENIRAAVAKIIIANSANQIVVNIIEGTMKDMAHYHWKLHPKEMVVEIFNEKKMPDPVPVVPAGDAGSVQ